MLISCSICKELFFPNSEVCGTKCGHIYHESCLKKWQERSGSCPQCRTKIREKPHRIYFDIEDSPESEAELDATALKHKICSIREDLADVKRRNKQLEEAYAKVHEEVAVYTEKVLTAEGTIKALKQRIKELVDQNKELEPLLKANETLRLKLKSFNNLETLLQGTESEVRALVSKTPVTTLAVHQLCMYVEVLKSQLKVTEEKYKKENEMLILRYNAAKQKLWNLKSKLCDKEIQTSKKFCKSSEFKTCPGKDLGPLESGLLKRSCAARTLPQCENKTGYSSSDAECEPPVKKKPLCFTHKKIINNLEKTVKKDIPSDSDDVLIYPGPSKYKISRQVGDLDNKSLFKNLRAPKKDHDNMKARTDVAYDVWGRSVRNILAVSSPAEERNHIKRLSKS